MAVTLTPRYTHPLLCQLSSPSPLPAVSIHQATLNSMHTHPPAHMSWVASGPGFTKTVSSSLLGALCLSAMLTECTVGGTMLFIPTTNGSSVSHHYTQPQHMSSCLYYSRADFLNIFHVILSFLPSRVLSHRGLLLFFCSFLPTDSALHACHTLSPQCSLLS